MLLKLLKSELAARFAGGDLADFGPLPALGQHTQSVRREFLG